MRKNYWENNLLDLIRRTATDLPADVEQALRHACRQEAKDTHGRWALRTILDTVELSRKEDSPLCQDSGTLVFRFRVPTGFDTNMLASCTNSAVAKATRRGYLRQNTIESVSGASSPTNIGDGSPLIHFDQGARKTIDVRLMMKGGGCENVGAQYALPDVRLGADRDLNGVRTCVLDAVCQAQGRGCPPGVLGVCIGGDRATGYERSKLQFLRKLNDESPVNALAKLEKNLMRSIRQLEIGPMGFGGKTTVLGVKIGAMSRLPASYFVTVSTMCWAFRRRGMVAGPEGGFRRWLY